MLLMMGAIAWKVHLAGRGKNKNLKYYIFIAVIIIMHYLHQQLCSFKSRNLGILRSDIIFILKVTSLSQVMLI